MSEFRGLNIVILTKEDLFGTQGKVPAPKPVKTAQKEPEPVTPTLIPGSPTPQTNGKKKPSKHK